MRPILLSPATFCFAAYGVHLFYGGFLLRSFVLKCQEVWQFLRPKGAVYKVGQLRYACFLAKSETHLAAGETLLFEAAQASLNKSGTNFLGQTLDSMAQTPIMNESKTPQTFLNQNDLLCLPRSNSGPCAF